jgi:putative CocE/NonD family hydrolase
VWCKLDLHLAGNILGYEKVAGPKKLLISGAPHMSAAQAEFESIAFHQRVLLPFYDRYLKGLDTDYEQRPAVEYTVRNSKDVVSQPQWPPAATHRPFYLSADSSGSVTSLNDGTLGDAPPDRQDAATAYTYPDHLWMLGHVTFGPNGPDGVARVLTFTSAPLADDLTTAGHAELILHVASTGPDTDIIVKLSAQAPQSLEDRARGLQPPSVVVTKGWLRASCRAVDPASREGAPVLTFSEPAPLKPGQTYELRVPLMPMAFRFAKGTRIRVEIACADSPITDAVFSHHFTPDRAGTDTIHHSAAYPSRLVLPVI